MLGASLVVLFSLVSVTHAGPLDLKQVAADAQWVVHSDADLMRTSPVVEKSYQAMAEEWPDQLEGHMDSLHDDFGIDMQNGMHSMTIYGKKLGKPTGVLIAHVDVNKELLEGKLKEAASYEAVEHGKHTVHCFDAGERGPMALMFYAPTTLIVGRGAGDVSAAADVLDGKAPNITAKKKSPLAAKVPADAMLVARAVGLSEADLPFKNPLLKQSDSVCLSFGIKEDEVFLDGELVTKSAETAPMIQSIFDGLRAAALLKLDNDPAVTKLLNTFTLKVSGKKVIANWRASADDLWTQGESIYSQWKSKQ
jgi:hypothetical protein